MGRSLGRWLRLVLGLDLEDRSTAVVAAIQAGAMRPLRLVAVRAFLELGQAEREVRAPVALPSVGDLALGHTHEVDRLLSMRCGSAIRRRRRTPANHCPTDGGVYSFSAPASTVGVSAAPSAPSSASSSTSSARSAARRGSIS